MNKTKFLVTIGSILIGTILSACGGGGGGGEGSTSPVTSDAQMSFSIDKSGTIQAVPGSSIAVFADASVRVVGTNSPTITTMGWSITPLNGTGAVSPTLSNIKPTTVNVFTSGECLDISKSINRGTCTTIITIPENIQLGTWTVTGRASASEGSSRTASFNIQVSTTNSSPNIASLFISSLPILGIKNQAVTIPAFYSFANGVNVAPANTSLTWTQTTGTPVVFSGQGTSSITFIPSVNGSYTFNVKLSAVINGVTETKTAQVVVFVSDVDFFNLSAGNLQSVNVNAVATLTAIVTNPSENAKNITYSWVQIDGPSNITLSNANSPVTTFIPTVDGTYNFRVTASTSSYSQSSTTTVYVLPLDANSFFIDAGAAQSIPAPNVSVALNGTFGGNSGAVVGNPAFSWVQLSGPGVVVSNPSSLKASFIPSSSGTYVFQLSALVKGITKTAITQVSVLGAVDPDIFLVSAGDSKVAVINTAVLLPGTVTTGTGLNGRPQTYMWTQQTPVAPASTVTISNANTKTASFVPPTIGTYVFTFAVTIDGVTKTATVTVRANAS